TKDADGRPGYAKTPLHVPARHNFAQGAIYQLKLTNISRRPDGFTVYPTLEVVPATEHTSEFLAHNYVPVAFCDEDFDRVVDGQYVVKVIYLADSKQGEARTETITSHQLEAGVDPIAEAQRRGSILAVIRLGTIDREVDDPSPDVKPTPV